MLKSKKFDFVIVGGGLGGLLVANILAVHNKKVCVLEQGRKIGGNLQTFVRKGCVFDTGMHYIGSYDKGQPLYQIFKYLDLVDKFKVQRLDDIGFDVFSIGDYEFKYATGYNNYARVLKDAFPGEEQAIDTYLGAIREVCTSVNSFRIFDKDFDRSNYLESYSHCAYKYIDGLTENRLLKAVLAGNNGLYCGNSQKTSVNLLANINGFFINSAWRLIGGGHQLANALKLNIENRGGVVIKNKKVVGLQFNSKQISAAITADEECFEADNFISGIHPALAMNWIEKGKLPKVFINRIQNLENTIGAFVLYLVVEKGKILHRNGNLYYSVDDNVWDINSDPQKPWPHGFLLYTTRDKETEYAESITVVTMQRYDEFKPWENTLTGRRGEGYEQLKKQKMKALYDLVSSKVKEIDGKVQHWYAATPLTFRDYTGTVNGSMYGIEKDCSRPFITNIPSRTKIPNFFFTGQNISNHGILGVAFSALMTCANFVDMQKLIAKIKAS